MKEDLKYIFDTVNSWLKFAEAKNTALFAFNGAIIFGVARLYSSNTALNQCVEIYLANISIFLLFSIIVSISSFLPILHTTFTYNSKKSRSKTPNLYFFGDISTFDSKSYLSALSEASGSIYTENKLDEQLAQQIIINSGIALRKYNYFDISIWLTSAGVFTPVITLFIWLYTKD